MATRTGLDALRAPYAFAHLLLRRWLLSICRMRPTYRVAVRLAFKPYGLSSRFRQYP